MQRLALSRPICFLDIESTGTDPENDRIVELATCKLNPDGTRESFSRRVNPWVPIPPEATEVHGITNEDVAGEPSFREIAPSLMTYLDSCDMAGFNSNSFDFPMLYAEFLRAGIDWDYRSLRFVDVGNLFKIRESRTLAAAVKFYLGYEHEGAHGAKADVEATVDVFLGQMSRYNDLPTDLMELDRVTNYGKGRLDLSGKFATNEAGQVVFNFGAHKGEAAVTRPGYLDWMINKARFAPDTVAIARWILAQKTGGAA